MSRTIAFIQARCSSTRLPGKVLADLGGQPLILTMIERVRRARTLDGVVLLTSDQASDDALAKCVSEAGTPVFRGALEDVLARFRHAAVAHPADHYVRLTGDCPLVDPAVIDAVVALHRSEGTDYCSNISPPTFPDGMDVEIFTAALLQRAHAEARERVEREHVTYWMYTVAASEIRRANYRLLADCSHVRLTVDYPDDIELMRELWTLLDTPATSDLFDILRVAQANSVLWKVDRHGRNDGLTSILAQDGTVAREGTDE